MNDGRILCQGTPTEVFSHYEELCSSGLALPQVTNIMQSVKKLCVQKGIPFPDEGKSFFTVEAAHKFLTGLLSDSKKEEVE